MLSTPHGGTPNMGMSLNYLPIELLTAIFWLAIENDDAYAPARNTLPHTLLLCSVCPAWRSLLLKNPSFWLCIPVGDRENSHHLTRLCLERSKGSLIDIFMRLHGKSGYEDWPVQQELILHTSRIQSVNVSGISNEFILSLLGRVLGDRPPKALTSLLIHTQRTSDFTTNRTWDLDENVRHNAVQRKATILYDQLHTLHLNGVSIPHFEGWEERSFSGLRELVLRNEHTCYGGMPYIMTTASNLQLLEFYDSVEWMANPTTLKPVLRPGPGSKILRLHKLPSETLNEGLKWIMPDAWSTEISIETRLPHPLQIHQNLSTVTALTLDNQKGPIHVGNYVPKLLAALPNLHSLTLERFELVEPTLSGITRPHDAGEAEFPRLSVLRLYSSRVLDHDAFKSAIASHPIRRLEIRNCALGWSRDRCEPDASCPLYSWLCDQVPELYLTGP
ncbi:hypothetical protein ACGC1H_004339 [Rhizoctonia solani]